MEGRRRLPLSHRVGCSTCHGCRFVDESGDLITTVVNDEMGFVHAPERGVGRVAGLPGRWSVRVAVVP